MPTTESFEARDGDATVRGVVHVPDAATDDGIVLAHGAGADRDSPVLRAVATALAARGVTALRIDLPFRQARLKGPPTQGWAARDREGLAAAVDAQRRRGARRIAIGGHSYGGRQASMLAAGAPDLAAALMLLAYPLHPPARPDRRRVEHFGALRTPTVFVHGTRDPFGTVAELEAARATIAARTILVVVDGTGHDLGARRSGAPPFADDAAAALLTLFG
ncbi:MAG TPA: alpha/beta fold hydrolase [Methylomirabilota bacterium]|nr:alpha/beta fold hydrolase [Methylomirabilota bacterium]